NRILVSGAPSPRETRPRARGVEDIAQQAAGEILSVDAGRPAPPDTRAVALEPAGRGGARADASARAGTVEIRNLEFGIWNAVRSRRRCYGICYGFSFVSLVSLASLVVAPQGSRE